MKKTVLFVAAAVLATATFAQDGLTSKKGEAYLPEAGDWAVGMNLTPFLDYATNGTLPTGLVQSNGNLNGSLWVGNNQPMTLVGKMFKDETTAYRMKLRIGFGSNTLEGVTDTSLTTLTGEYTDEMKSSGMMITLGGGLEKRKGNTRLQGYYGAEALVSFGASATEYSYANEGSGTAASGIIQPSQFDFGNNTAFNGNANERVTKHTDGASFVFQLRGFIGVEYFFAPKISVSAEYGWGLAMNSTGDGETTTESWGPATSSATANSLISFCIAAKVYI